MDSITYIEPEYHQAGQFSLYIDTPGHFNSKYISINGNSKFKIGGFMSHNIIIKNPKEYCFHKIMMLLVKKTKIYKVASRSFFINKYSVLKKKRIILESVLKGYDEKENNNYDRQINIKASPHITYYLEKSQNCKGRKIEYYLQVYVQFENENRDMHIIKKKKLIEIY